jgi:hypothetical protein
VPAAPALTFRSTLNQRGKCGPIFITVRLYRILQRAVFEFCPFTLSRHAQCLDPRYHAICSSTVFAFDPEPERTFQPKPCHRAFVPHPSASCLRLLFTYPCVHQSGRCGDPRYRAICFYTVYSFDTEPALHRIPILATVRLYCILQRAIFDCYPFTLASTRQGDAGIQDIVPLLSTLLFRSTWNQRGNCDPTLAPCVCTTSFSLLFSSSVY